MCNLFVSMRFEDSDSFRTELLQFTDFVKDSEES